LRQKQIIWLVLSFLTDVFNEETGIISNELSSMVGSLVPLLEQNSYDAVFDYLLW